MCNVAYSIQVEHMDAEQQEDFDGQIGQRENPEDVAREALKAHQEAAGMTFADPDAPVVGQPGAAGDERL
jgi:hypothetical protein